MKKYYKHINIDKEKKLFEGLDAFSNYLVGKIKNIFLSTRELRIEAKKIFDLSMEYAYLSESELNIKILYYQRKIKLNKYTSQEFIEAFAIVVELGFRETNKRAYVVQIMGSLASLFAAEGSFFSNLWRVTKRFVIDWFTGVA